MILLPGRQLKLVIGNSNNLYRIEVYTLKLVLNQQEYVGIPPCWLNSSPQKAWVHKFFHCFTFVLQVLSYSDIHEQGDPKIQYKRIKIPTKSSISGDTLTSSSWNWAMDTCSSAREFITLVAFLPNSLCQLVCWILIDMVLLVKMSRSTRAKTNRTTMFVSAIVGETPVQSQGQPLLCETLKVLRGTCCPRLSRMRWKSSEG